LKGKRNSPEREESKQQMLINSTLQISTINDSSFALPFTVKKRGGVL